MSSLVIICGVLLCLAGACLSMYRRLRALEKTFANVVEVLDRKIQVLGKSLQTLLGTAGRRELESLGAESAEGGLFADQIASLREAAGKADPANDEEMAIAAKLLSTADDLEGLSTTLSTTLSGLCGGS